MSDAPVQPPVWQRDLPPARPLPESPSGGPLPQYTQWLRWLIVGVCALASWTCIDLVRISSRAAPTNPLINVVCGDPSSGCVGLLRSEKSMLVLGVDSFGEPIARVPWAILGLGYFAAVGLWFVLVGPVSRGATLWIVPLLLIELAGGVISFDLIQTMAVELRRWCLGCTLAHALNAAIILLTIGSLPWRARNPTARPYPRPSHALAGCVAAIMTFSTLFLYGVAGISVGESNAYRALLFDPEYVRWRYDRAPVQTIPPLTNAGSQQSTSAPIAAPHRVVIFSDYACGHCRAVHSVLRKFMSAHPNVIQIEMRNYPLDDCNKYAANKLHPFACAAARAAEAVRTTASPEAFASYQVIVFEHQAAIDAAHLREWALEAGADAAKFDAARASPDTARHVETDIELAHSLGVSATPAVFLDGRRVEASNIEYTWLTLLGFAPQSRPAALDPANNSPTQNAGAFGNDQ